MLSINSRGQIPALMCMYPYLLETAALYQHWYQNSFFCTPEQTQSMHAPRNWIKCTTSLVPAMLVWANSWLISTQGALLCWEEIANQQGGLLFGLSYLNGPVFISSHPIGPAVSVQVLCSSSWRVPVFSLSASVTHAFTLEWCPVLTLCPLVCCWHQSLLIDYCELHVYWSAWELNCTGLFTSVL